jgi:hypothetical protein
VKKGQNGRKSLRRLKLTVGSTPVREEEEKKRKRRRKSCN